jgi:hypothetical protein
VSVSGGQPSGLRERVSRFFWAETTGEAAALFRIAFGLLLVHYLLVYVGWNLTRYEGDSGILPHELFLRYGGGWTLLAFSPSPALLWALWGLTLAAAIAFTAGFHARAAAAVLYAGILSIHNRNRFVLNGAELLLIAIVFLCILAPVSLRYSLAARREGPRTAPLFGLQLLRLQIVLVYASTAVQKSRHSLWRSGDALQQVLDAQMLATWTHGVGSPIVGRVLSWGTLAVEALFFLVFWKRFRPWVLAAGVALHLSIEVMLAVPMFSAVMLVSYLTFLDDDEARAIASRLSRPFVRRS